MPTTTPTLGSEHIRNYAEKWYWMEGGQRKVGYNVPDRYRDTAHQLPFHIRCITLDGALVEGDVICIKVFPEKRQRLIRFVNSNQIRRICDCLIISIDGTRFIAH